MYWVPMSLSVFNYCSLRPKKNIKWLPVVFQLLKIVSAMFELFLVWTPFVYLAKLCYDLTVFFNWQSCLFSSYYILNISDVYTFEFRNSLVGIWVKLLMGFFFARQGFSVHVDSYPLLEKIIFLKLILPFSFIITYVCNTCRMH